MDKEGYIKTLITDMMIKWGVGVDYRPSEVFAKPQPTAYLSPNGQGLRADLMSLVAAESSLAYQEGHKDGYQQAEQELRERSYDE